MTEKLKLHFQEMRRDSGAKTVFFLLVKAPFLRALKRSIKGLVTEK